MFTVLLLFHLSALSSQEFNNEPFMSSMEIITHHGYPAEAHKVVTEDGYILTMHRMPHGRTNNSRGGRPVLLLHGLTSSSFDFLSETPKKALSYALADEGYDVWIGNNRGNIFAMEHRKYDSFDSRFWNFSLDEMATYDTPAMVDYILNHTNHSDLYVVGFSQGALVMFAAAVNRPDIQSKIKHHFALAPGLRIADVHSPLLALLIQNSGIVEDAETLIPAQVFAIPSLFALCGPEILRIPCKLLLTEVFGPSRLPLLTSHLPAGTSSKTLVHWFQFANHGTNHFDYGKSGNLELYGTPHPQPYNFTSYSVPTSLYYSHDDKVVTPENAKLAIELLPPSTIIRSRNLSGYSHMDFIWGNHAKGEIYDEIIEDINKMETLG